MDRRLPPDDEPGADEADALRELLVSAVPEPVPVPDRLARIEFLVHRRRRRRLAAAAIATAAAAVIGFGALNLGGGTLHVEPQPADSVTLHPTPSLSAGTPTGSVRPSLSPTPQTYPTQAGPTRTAQAGPNASASSATVTRATDASSTALAAADLVVPEGSAGSAGPRVSTGLDDPPLYDGSGIFRTYCLYSHMSTADPLTGRATTSTLRTYWGNTAADATIAQAPTSRGNSTCRGGTLDRSVYWSASVVDTAARRAIAPTEVRVFFHTGYEGVSPDQVEVPPAGLRMSAGQTADGYTRITGPGVEWNCGGQAPGVWSAQRPDCSGRSLYLRVMFPQCWDGRLDSPDSRAHLAYAARTGCPATHPRALPEISYWLLFDAPASGVASWQLAQVAAGEPVAGFVNGWDGATLQRWTSLCLTGARNCISHLGDGQVLLGDL